MTKRKTSAPSNDRQLCEQIMDAHPLLATDSTIYEQAIRAFLSAAAGTRQEAMRRWRYQLCKRGLRAPAAYISKQRAAAGKRGGAGRWGTKNRTGG